MSEGSGAPRILCVDNEDDARLFLHLALSSTGTFEVEMLDAPDCFFRAVERFCPDMVILDVALRGTDGPTLLRELRASQSPARNVPVLFLAAKAEGADLETYREAGAVTTLAKPFDPTTVAAQVQQVWNTLHPLAQAA